MYSCLDCGRISSGRYCDQHSKDGKRPSPRERGYGPEFVASRAKLLASKPSCVKCGKPATVAHHRPARKRLVAMGVADPDAVAFLEGLCAACHDGETAAGR
jgi:5-methylcytosine-specific restriction protein A